MLSLQLVERQLDERQLDPDICGRAANAVQATLSRRQTGPWGHSCWEAPCHTNTVSIFGEPSEHK